MMRSSFTSIRPALVLVFAAVALGFGGCATAPRVISLPYEMPGAPVVVGTAPVAEIVDFADSRDDRSLDAFLAEPPVEFVRKALAAELVSGGAFSRVELRETVPSSATVAIKADLREISWAVPNHKGIVRTAFWTSFLTGGVGGVAYGATETPVFGRAVIALKLEDRATGRVMREETFEALHEERTAKLKCDTLETRSRVMAAALKAALTKATEALAKSYAAPAAP